MRILEGLRSNKVIFQKVKRRRETVEGTEWKHFQLLIRLRLFMGPACRDLLSRLGHWRMKGDTVDDKAGASHGNLPCLASRGRGAQVRDRTRKLGLQSWPPAPRVTSALSAPRASVSSFECEHNQSNCQDNFPFA